MSTEGDQDVETTDILPQQLTQTKKRRKDKLETLANVEILFEESLPAKETKRKRIYKRPVPIKISTAATLTEQPEPQNVTKAPAKNEEQSLLQEAFNKNCEIFLNFPDTDKYLRRIAEEQVRINYLLAVYGMPDINFNLWSDTETLEFQLRERLKQRSVRKNNAEKSSS